MFGYGACHVNEAHIAINKMKSTLNYRGFTVVELMIALAMAAIFASLALPSFVVTVRQTRLATTGDLLNADLLVARDEAIKRNGRVYVCPVGPQNDGTCGTDFTAWAGGWLVCYDVDNKTGCNKPAAASTDPNPIVNRGPLDPSVALNGPSSAVQFNSDGTQAANTNLDFTITGTWSGSNATGSAYFVASVAPSGNISLKKKLAP